MSDGIIASRYAKALLKLVDETGNGERVVHEVQMLQDALGNVPDLRRVVDDQNAVTPEQKITLLETVLKQSMSSELGKFIGLLMKNGRITDIRLIFNSFISLYYKSRGIIRGRLVFPSADPSPNGSEDLAAMIKDLVESRTGKKLLLRTEIDGNLIGGFILEVEDQLLDASVSHQLDRIRKQFIERNRRIV